MFVSPATQAEARLLDEFGQRAISLVRVLEKPFELASDKNMQRAVAPARSVAACIVELLREGYA